MDFKPTEEQELMVQAIEEAMTRENLETYFQDCDREHKHPKKWWDLLDELGLFSMFLPEEAGGDGEGAITMFLVMEALGRCGGPIYLFWDHVKADALLENGTKEQIDKFMPMFFEGKPAFAQGFSEPNAGTDLSPATISHHMNSLVTAGFISMDKQGTRVSYSVNQKYVDAFLQNLGNTLG